MMSVVDTEMKRDRLLIDLFAEQVLQRPDALAVLCGPEQLTYRELDQRANQLAHTLRKHGVQKEVKVGLCVDRTPDLIVGLLGIWKAGGAFVPLDPHYPQDRLTYLLQDSGLQILLSHSRWQEKIQQLDTCAPIWLDLDRKGIEREPVDMPEISDRSLHDLAYVIYTSGSTGRPKGVMVEHRGLGNLTAAIEEYLQVGPGQRILQFASPSFDAGIHEIISAIMTGGTLVLADRESLLPSPELIELLQAYRINVMFMPPSALAMLPDAELPDLQTIYVAGEACPQSVVQRWSRGRRFVNVYGPTEATIATTAYTCSADEGEKPPIGHPLPGYLLQVVDAQGLPVANGVPGELYIGGIGLARGYWNREDLTAEKFILHTDGERYYRTGDLVRVLPDGALEFIGRIDHQIKIRGFRVELGEIRETLCQHPAVRDAVVLYHQDEETPRLVAYAIASDSVQPSYRDVRDFLRKTLPDYMLPAACLWLEQFPLTPNGKVDLQALPKIAKQMKNLHTPEPKRVPVQQLVAEIWSDVLGVEDILDEDHFLELGGHSLTATLVVSRIRERLHKDISIRSLYDIPNFLAWTRHVESAANLSPVSHLVQLPDSDAGIPLSSSQNRMWFSEQFHPEQALYNIPLVFRLHGTLDVFALEKSLQEMVKRHHVLRTRIVEVSGEPMQVVGHPEEWSMQIRETPSAETPAADAGKSFNLAEEYPLRCRLLIDGEQSFLLSFTFHHIALDGWSLDYFFEELGNWYFLFTGGRGLVPTEPLFQYADFARWQRNWLGTDAYQRQLAYWVAQLQGAPEALDLPTDRPRSAVQTYNGARVPLELPASLIDSLRTQGRGRGASLYMMLVAAFQTLLHLQSGQEDILVGSPIANRNVPEFERLLGVFVNTLAMRTRFEAGMSFEDVVQQVRQTVLTAYENQDVPFEKVVEALGVRRSLQRSPLFQVMLVLHNQRNIGLQLPGVDVYQLDVQLPTTQFDLVLDLTEGPDGCVGWLSYNTDLFDESTIRQWAEMYLDMLETVCLTPELSIEQLRGSGRPGAHSYTVRHPSLPPLRKVESISYRQTDETPSEVETELARIWGELFEGAQIERRANFFEVGGHSLLAVKVISRVRETWGVQLPLKSFFATPTIADFAVKIQEALENDLPPSPVKIDSPEQTHSPRISPAQQRLWYLDQVEAAGRAYNMTFRLNLSGALREDLFEKAIREIVRRHEALRTVFHKEETDGFVYQVVQPHPVVEIERLDLSGRRGETETEIILQDLESELAGRTFDLVEGPLTRFVLVKRNEADYLLLFAVHHIVFDGWSFDLFLNEFLNLYGALAEGQEPQVPELPIQYREYADRQRKEMDSTVAQEQLSYWRKQLEGAPALLDLPTDRPRPALQQFRGDHFAFAIPDALAEEVMEWSRRQQTSLFTVLLTAFHVLLHRMSHQEDILIGVPTAGRNQVETEKLIGFFVNTLVIRTQTSGQTTFSSLVKNMQETLLEAMSHGDVPFDKVVEEVKPQRNLSYNPLFQVMFLSQEFLGEEKQTTGLTVSAESIENGTTAFDLTLTVETRGGRLNGLFGYNTDLFDQESIERMSSHFVALLQGMVEQPQRPVGEVPMLTQAEQAWLEDRNRTEYLLSEQTFSEQFRAQAEARPNQVALVYEHRSLTYWELEQASNQLAHYLRAKGVNNGSLVGLSLERSLEMVVALLAVLKAGAAFVPIDPALPPERIAYIEEHAQLSYRLTGAELQGQKEWINTYPRELPDMCSNLDDLAYVLYTSGSTGKPKGVQIEQRSLMNLLEGLQQLLCLQEQDSWLALTTFSFDISILELLLPLLVGARVHVAPTHAAIDSASLIELIACSHPTVMQATPVAYRLLLEAGWEGNEHLQLICGGEALPSELATELLTKCRVLWNMYGPTETTIYSAASRVQSGQPVTIGRPIANTRLYVLDAKGLPVPIGVPGELYIGGLGVARGYLHNPELTAEKFLPDTRLSTEKPERMFRTGDSVRWKPDGQLQFLQRIDNQVKLRGYRIELGEIEAVLSRREDISQGVVLIVEQESGEKELSAYMIPSGDSRPSARELRESLGRFLPSYMIPTLFGWVEEFPLTTSGKVDRKALALVPVTKALLKQNNSAPPRDTMEKELVGLWEEVMQVHPIGIRDSFYEIGGHSLLMVQLMNQIKKRFEIEVSMNFFMQNPTIEELAVLLRKGIAFERPDHALVPLQPQGDRRPLFVVHAVGGNLFSYSGLARIIGDDQPLYGLQMIHLDLKKAPSSLREMAAVYVAEIVEKQPEGPYVLGGYSFGGNVAYEMAVQLQEQGRHVANLILFDANLIVEKPNAPIDEDLMEVMYLQRFDHLEESLYPRITPQALLEMTRPERWVYLLNLSKAYGFLPPDAELAEFQDTLYSWSINIKVLLEYVPRPAQIPITFFKTSSSRESTVEEWEELTSLPIECMTVTGIHGTMMREPHVQMMVEPIRAVVEQAERLMEAR